MVVSSAKKSFVRYGLNRGLKYKANLGTNPFWGCGLLCQHGRDGRRQDPAIRA